MFSKQRIAAFVAALFVISFAGDGQRAAALAAAPTDQEANVQAYIELLRTDIRQGKLQILNQVMGFTQDEASVFWPIYRQYDAELSKLGDRKITLIKDYAANYRSLTDAKADQLVNSFLEVREERDKALRNCYQQVRAKMGGKTAARFIQVESQLLHLIDLQVASLLPTVE